MPIKYETKTRKYYRSQGLEQASGVILADKRGSSPAQLVRWSKMTNMVPVLDDKVVKHIGARVVEEYKYDKEKRKGWEQTMELAQTFVKIEVEKKDTPFSGACAVILPLLAQACVQFSARATQALLANNEIAKGKVIGQDNEGKDKAASAQRVADFINYQITEEMTEWIPDTDTALFALPLFGAIFKKTYYFAEERRNYSEYVSPLDLVINPGVTDIKKCKRITHWIERTKNEVIERTNNGAWSDILSQIGEGDSEAKQTSPNEEEGNYIFLEQHRWWDLDGDGYAEPYIVTVHKDTDTVARIKARYTADDLWLTADKKKIARIECRQIFNRLLFMPSIDKSIYGFGFGQLLTHPNDAINTIIREIIDAGRWYNTNAGLYSSGLNINMTTPGAMEFEPNEFKEVDDVDDIRKKFFMLPAREPSMTLYNTLGLLFETYQRLAMSTDVLSGQAGSANQPATTTLALIEQGLKLHTAVMNRVHRGIGEELKLLFRLNAEHLNEEQYYTVMDTAKQVFVQDFNIESVDISLSAMPEDVMHIQKMLKADKLMEMRSTVAPPVAEEIFQTWLEAMQIEDRERFKVPADYKPPPDPEIVKINAEMELEGAKLKLDVEKLRLDSKKQDQDYQIKLKELAIKKMEAAARMKLANKSDKEKKNAKTTASK